MTVRRFLDDFVMPTLHEWAVDPLDVRKATLAACQLDILAERFIIHLLPTASTREERDRLGEGCREVALVRDIHDSHKHGALTRKTAIFRSNQRPEVRQAGGGVGSMALGTWVMGGTDDHLVVFDDDGGQHRLDHVLRDCLRYWREELDRAGL